MTSHAARLYALAGSLLVFFLAWAGIAANPWKQSVASTGPATSTLARYQQQLRAEAALVDRLAAQRAAASSSSAAPRVRVVMLPPVTTTRTS